MYKCSSLLLLAMVASLVVYCCPLPADAQGIFQGTQIHQGSCFAYLVPMGWRHNDTMNGVDLLSPDGSRYVFLSLLERMPGRQTPEGFLKFCARTMKVQNMRIISAKPGPPVPMYQTSQTFELLSTYNGVPMRTRCVCAVSNGWGQWGALCSGYSDLPNRFDAEAPTLQRLALSIKPTGGAAIAGSNTILMPRNNPNTAGDTIMQSWAYRNHIMDHISQEREEAILGITRQKDPLTGTVYDMPLSRYNASRGGYVNPYRPTELLQHAQPGE